MTRPLNRVYCRRPNGAHELAAVRVTEHGGREAVVATVVATPNGMTEQRRVFTDSDLAEAAALIVITICACGERYDVDVAALLRGEDTLPQRAPAGSQTGVSYDRKRHKDV